MIRGLMVSTLACSAIGPGYEYKEKPNPFCGIFLRWSEQISLGQIILLSYKNDEVKMYNFAKKSLYANKRIVVKATKNN